MSSLTIKQLDEILESSEDTIANYKFFVETGTYHGDTILEMSKYFDKSYTVELSNDLYDRFNKKDFDRNKITSLLGDSSKVLKDIILELKDNSIFFLDGHFSSCGTAKGEKDVPLLEEIRLINDFYKFKGIIIIDDLRLFNTKKTEDWSEITIESVENEIKDKIYKKIILGDRLILVINY
jgi:hypothetical protein